MTDQDVYVCGEEFNSAGIRVAKYWKNGQPVELGINSYAESIFVDGNDVYVAGAEYANGNIIRAVYWKNGIVNYLSIRDCVLADGRSQYLCAVLKAWVTLGGGPISTGSLKVSLSRLVKYAVFSGGILMTFMSTGKYFLVRILCAGYEQTGLNYAFIGKTGS